VKFVPSERVKWPTGVKLPSAVKYAGACEGTNFISHPAKQDISQFAKRIISHSP